MAKYFIAVDSGTAMPPRGKQSVEGTFEEAMVRAMEFKLQGITPLFIGDESIQEADWYAKPIHWFIKEEDHPRNVRKRNGGR